MLGDDPLVLNRQLPPGKRDHASTGLDVTVVHRRAEQRLRHGPDAKGRRLDECRGYSSRRKEGTSSTSLGTSKLSPAGVRSGRSRSRSAVSSAGGRARRRRGTPKPVATTVTRTSSLTA